MTNNENEVNLEAPTRRSVALVFSTEDMQELMTVAERFNSLALSILVENRLTCAVLYPDDGETENA